MNIIGILKQNNAFFFPHSVLLQLASDALPNDVTLALAYLLALPQVSLPLTMKKNLKYVIKNSIKETFVSKTVLYVSFLLIVLQSYLIVNL
jgi:hypothetical protein